MKLSLFCCCVPNARTANERANKRASERTSERTKRRFERARAKFAAQSRALCETAASARRLLGLLGSAGLLASKLQGDSSRVESSRVYSGRLEARSSLPVVRSESQRQLWKRTLRAGRQVAARAGGGIICTRSARRRRPARPLALSIARKRSRSSARELTRSAGGRLARPPASESDGPFGETRKQFAGCARRARRASRVAQAARRARVPAARQ